MTSVVEDTLLVQRSAERQFAACVLTDPELARREAGWLSPDVIFDERIRKFWSQVRDGCDPYEAAYAAGLQTELLAYVVENPTSQAAQEFASIIAAGAYLAQVGQTLPVLARAIGVRDIAGLRQALRDLAELAPGSERQLPNAVQIAREYEAVLNGENRCIRTGIAKLDENAGGVERTTLTVLAGTTSTGKTALALQMARTVAGPGANRALYFSLEMDRLSLWGRMAAPTIGVSHQDVIAHRLTPEQRERLEVKSFELAQFYAERLIIEDGRHTTESIWQIVAQVRPDLVIVDHLRMLKDKNPSEVKRQGGIVERLHDLAKAYNCHVLLLAQLSRAHLQGNDKRPHLQDLRDSGEIEENADNVLMLYRDDIYNPPIPRPPYLETELWIRKFRNGGRDGLVRLGFDEKQQWFWPWPVPPNPEIDR